MSRMRVFLYGAAAGILLCSGGKRIARTGLGIGKRIVGFVRESGARIAEEWAEVRGDDQPEDRPEAQENVEREAETRPKAKVSRKKKASRKP